MATKIITASADTWLDNTNTSTNFGSNTDFYFGEYDAGSQTSRALIKFDLSSIPTNATVTSAIIRIRSLGDLSSNNRTGRVYRLLRNWVETEATWNNYSTGNAWGTAGAAAASDRETTDIGSATFNSSNPSGTDNNITLTASAIQEMIAGTFTNNGFLLKMDSEIDDMQRFYSKEHGTAANRPDITITYTVPTDATGGTITHENGYTFHHFTTSGTFTIPSGSEGTIDLLVVGGGGGGGGCAANSGGGGGGAGKVSYQSLFLPSGAVTVTVGNGGTAGTSGGGTGGTGDTSSFGAYLSSVGGSGGPGGSTTGRDGGTSGQPLAGGTGGGGTWIYSGGGGGGAGAVGGNSSTTQGGNGGAGLDYSATFGTSFGESGYFGGGGGGPSGSSGTNTSGGMGGGADGIKSNDGSAAPAGTANTGGGGSGISSGGTKAGGAGGSGVVLIKYLTDSLIPRLITGNYAFFM